MKITEVRIKLMEDSDDRLQAFCSITFDDSFVVRDLKIIEGTNGPFVAMPSRKLTSHCGSCGSKNHMRASYCNNCGSAVKDDPSHRDSDGRNKLYADIAHPINSECREMIQNRVISEFEGELQRASQPGYVSRYDDEYLHEDGASQPPSREAASTNSKITNIQPAQSGPAAPHIRTPSTTGDAASSRSSTRRRGQRPDSNDSGKKTMGADDADSGGDFGQGIF